MVQQLEGPPAKQEVQETGIQPIDQEDPLEEEMATHSSILAWRIQWTEETDIQSKGLQRARHDWANKRARPWYMFSRFWIYVWIQKWEAQWKIKELK